ncbi:MAG: molybdopterin-binding protein [Cyanobacteria bacterium P01_E01_bin.43]
MAVSYATITVSDTRTHKTDTSDQLMRSQLTTAGHRVSHYQLIKDEPPQISALVQRLAERSDVQAILLNGGTGIAPRDTAFDAIVTLLEKTLPGFGEIFR